MKYLLALALASGAVCADPIGNINGISNRLESLTCWNAGYMTSMAQAKKVNQNAEKECDSIPEDQMEACFREVVKKNAEQVNVIFRGTAIAKHKEFKMVITSGNSNHEYFNSLREGFHGDGPDGITLMFNRAGVRNDDFLIETGLISEDGTSTPMVIVPVKRRLLADQVYFFFDCKLIWAE